MLFELISGLENTVLSNGFLGIMFAHVFGSYNVFRVGGDAFQYQA